MVTRPFDGRELGEPIKDLASPLPELTLFGVMLGCGKDIVHFMRATQSLTSAIYVVKRLSKHVFDAMRAIKLVVGDLGTYARIKMDAHARALDAGRRHQGPLCRRQRHGEHYRRQPSRRWHHAWTGTDLRLYRRTAHCGHVILELSIPTSGGQMD
jgi:hypothetical protein